MVQEIIRKNERGKNEVIRQRILIGGKEVKLKFTMPMWYRMEDEICLMDDLYDLMHSKGRLKRGRMPALAELMSGGEIAQDDVLKEEDPATIRALMDEIQNVIAKAVSMKERKYDDNSVHDETLEEIEKKDQQAG